MSVLLLDVVACVCVCLVAGIGAQSGAADTASTTDIDTGPPTTVPAQASPKQRACTNEDFVMKQTQCDEYEQRWFVGTPKFGSKCSGGYRPAPMLGRPCNYTCKPGQYMSEVRQECFDCELGTYSLGNGARWEDFAPDRLPGGFSIQPRDSLEEIKNIKGILTSEEHNLLSSAKELEQIFHDASGRGRRATAGPAKRSSSEDDDSAHDSDFVGDGDAYDECAGHGWKAEDGNLVMDKVECSSSITIEVDLVTDGEVRLQYSYPKGTPFWLMLEVKSYRCSGTSAPTHFYKALNTTQVDSFPWTKVELKAGHNVISILAISNFGDRFFSMPIVVQRIEMSGLAYATACTKCPAGTYASEVASMWCDPCLQQTYSDMEGAHMCKECDEATQYANKEHTSCLNRKACTEDDYTRIYGACNANGRTSVKHEWAMPKLCIDDVAGAVKLPEPKLDVPCPSCNAGFSIQGNNSEGDCGHCPRGTVSDGTRACSHCRPGYQAIKGMHFHWWNKHTMVGDDLDMYCTTPDGHGNCPGDDRGWVMSNNFLESRYSAMKNGATAHLLINTLGFTGHQAAAEQSDVVGSVEFTYEVACPPSMCEFAFHDMSDLGSGETVWKWNGDRRSGKFMYHVKSRGFHDFHWTFTVGSGGQWSGQDYSLLKIFSIDINNTIDGGGVLCQDCSSLGLSSAKTNNFVLGGESCVGCPDGNYLDVSDAKDHKCRPCPAGTAMSGSRRIGLESCVKCGAGTTSLPESVTCYMPCQFNDRDGAVYNFSQLAGAHPVRTASRFTPKGTRYVYEYLLSICGPAMSAKCYGNVTDHHGSLTRKHGLFSGYETVESKVCRHTVAYIKSTPLLHGYPLGLGVNLLGVERIHPDMNQTATDALAARTMNASLASVKLANTTGKSLISLFFHSDKGESRCEMGRMAVVNLHCDASKEGAGELRLATTEDCPEGTCDGCTFNFIWHTAHACPVCTEADYRTVKGSCFSNQSYVVEYVWKGTNGMKSCSGGVHLPATTTKDCDFIDINVGEAVKKYKYVLLAIPGLGLVILLALVFVVCKNRRLSYQYHKLVQSSSAAGELPAPPTCVDDEDEEEEEVMFSRGQSQTKKLVRKLQGLTKSGSKKRQQELESDVMMSEMPLTETADV